MAEHEETVGRIVLGVSFGNSYSSIAWTSAEGKPEVIANEEGDRQIPTVLSYVDGEEFHGTQAKGQLVRNPRNTVTGFRDFVGKEFSAIDPTNCHASAHPIAAESTIAFNIKDTDSSEEHTRTVSELTTRHLKRLQSSAADYLGRPIEAAVITVPTDFTDAQKTALTAAAKATNLEVLQFIPEPIAALLAYDARDASAAVKDRIVVFGDFGGTRSDVAVIAARRGMYTVLATAHDYETAGAQLDQALIDYAAKEFLKKHKSDPRHHERSLAKLKLEAESVKKHLSIGSSAAFSIETLHDGHDFSLSVNRTRFDILGAKVFASLTRLVESAVKKADLDMLDVGEVILSGGTSHTPKLARSIKSAFPESVVVHAPATNTEALNPSELSARGAAIQGSLVSEFDKSDIEQSVHPAVTVTPHLQKAIGVMALGGHEESFIPVVEAATALPVRKTVQIPVSQAGDVLIKLCEGTSHIKVTKQERPATNGEAKAEIDSDDDDEEPEDEEIKNKVWTAGTTLAEICVRDVKKGAKVELQVNVDLDLGVQVTAREVGGKGGVRGSIQAGK